MRFDLVDHYKILKSARSVILVGREEGQNGRIKHYFIVKDHYPYFGVPWDERNLIEDEYGVIKVEENHNIKGKKIAKITVKRADDVPILRDRFSTTYESNVLFHHRVKIDLKIRSGFEVPDSRITGACFGCQRGSQSTYHEIPSNIITGW